MAEQAQAIYFPVRDTPMAMQPGLHPLGTDFGNGKRESQFFQVDRERERYLAAKRKVPAARSALLLAQRTPSPAHRTIIAWIEDQWEREHPGYDPLRLRGRDIAEDYQAIASHLQEDFAVLARDPSTGNETALAVYVAFPSAWRPERIVGQTFAGIHDPVPGFADDSRQAASLVSSMIDRGPYVRFVWTPTADDHLDHHPESASRCTWERSQGGWLRVERQVTLGFPRENAALFLIRTYLYSFARLPAERRAVVRRALERMPRDIARYKGLAGRPREIALGLLVD